MKPGLVGLVVGGVWPYDLHIWAFDPQLELMIFLFELMIYFLLCASSCRKKLVLAISPKLSLWSDDLHTPNLMIYILSLWSTFVFVSMFCLFLFFLFLPFSLFVFFLSVFLLACPFFFSLKETEKEHRKKKTKKDCWKRFCCILALLLPNLFPQMPQTLGKQVVFSYLSVLVWLVVWWVCCCWWSACFSYDLRSCLMICVFVLVIYVWIFQQKQANK